MSMGLIPTKKMSRSMSGRIMPSNKYVARVSCDMFDGPFGTQNAMVRFIFRFEQREGEGQVKRE